MTPGNPPLSFPAFPNDAQGIDLKGDAQRAEAFLRSVQGNILKGHGRNNARLVFFRFGSDQNKNQALLRDAVTDQWVQSAWTQQEYSKKYQVRDLKYLKNPLVHLTPEQKQLQADLLQLPFGSLALTTWGLAALGCVDASGFAPPRSDFKSPAWPGSFCSGMRQVMADVEIPPKEEPLIADWEPAYTDEPAKAIHGVFLLACDDGEKLKRLHDQMKGWLCSHGACEVHAETGTTWRYKNRVTREAFGFVDGLSQPAFFAHDRQPGDEAKRKWIDLKLADVFITPKQSRIHAGGSYLAFLKFEQNVDEFRKQERLIRRQMGRPDSYHYAPAFPLGRWRDGCPLHQAHASPRPEETSFNSFDFTQEGNPKTTGCPFHAHIRKMNPRVNDRDNVFDGDTIVRSQLVRRGMIYDEAGALQKRANRRRGRWPSEKVGLLFMAYMNSILTQFERLHNDWAMDPHFPRPGNGEPDGLLRPGHAPWDWQGATMPKNKCFLRRLGGHYFYVPSIPWLENAGYLPPVTTS